MSVRVECDGLKELEKALDTLFLIGCLDIGRLDIDWPNTHIKRLFIHYLT